MGSLVLISSKLKLKVGQVDIDDEWHILFNAETHGVNLLFGNVYLPTRDKEQLQFQFLEKIRYITFKETNPRMFNNFRWWV